MALSHDTPEGWARKNVEIGCRCVNFPVTCLEGEEKALAYANAAKAAGLAIAELGVWKNPISPNEDVRREALAFAKGQLRLADMLGARCAVNVVGAMGELWDGAYKENFTKETWKRVVASIREIIDDVQPKNTYYTIEPMPWMYPTGPDEYLRLIEDVARDRFAVHMDIFNWMTTPERYFFNENFMEETFAKLGRHIKSCHLKDVRLEQPFTIMFREVACGEGAINLERYAKLASKYDPDMPMIIEHLSGEDAYLESMGYVRSRLGEWA
ncbi:MAG: sugar phosphate isomerase/epimerase [Lachnospiraceae bacterium]|jgi:sugar phosphate isomerase/epimerase|nr:sugar phosphate isomerase/epimerase [Lachnospiraceae bacterium]